MGKIEISEDLRSKLNKVLSYKSADIGDMAVGPAPSWKPILQPQQPPPQPPQQPPPQPPQQPPPQPPQQPPPQPPPQPPQQPSQQPHQQLRSEYYVKSEKNKKKKDKIKYYKITKIVFLSSVVAGLGITLGLKIANILFY
jgi:hypothetical protein